MMVKDMYARKLQKVGYNSLVVTLPREWVKKNAIRPQDVVLLSISDDGTLVVQPESMKKIGKEHKSVTIDWQKGKGFAHVANALMKAYIHGNETIILRKQESEEWPGELWLTLECLLGVTVLENTPTTLNLQCFVDVPYEGMDDLLGMLHKVQHSVCDSILASISGSRSPDREINNMVAEGERQCSLLLRSLMSAQPSGPLANEPDITLLALTSRDVCIIMKSILDRIRPIPKCNCTKQCAQLWQMVIKEIDALFAEILLKQEQRSQAFKDLDEAHAALVNVKHLSEHPEPEAKMISYTMSSAFHCLCLLRCARNWIRWIRSGAQQ
jgi:phosphate uptake regulator